ncbi:MAG: hypothetical protein GQ570_09620 [Helicobacteraceae bacterium]|nr:hypothetical protein [Helicobacteraceae bacterium]
MIYLIVALNVEAQPIIDKLKLQKFKNMPFKSFYNSEYILTITGLGVENALMATTAIFTKFPPSEEDKIINFGICAAPKKYEIGELLLIDQISYKDETFKTKLAFQSTLKEENLTTLDKASSNELNTLVDMEAYGVYKAAKIFVKPIQLLFLKIVSDHFKPETITKDFAKELISNNLESLFIEFEKCKK